MTKTKTSLFILYTVLLLFLSFSWNTNNNGIHAFYLPGVHPQSFEEGELVKLKVNKMTSPQTLIPLEYYQFPFCQPDGGPKMDNENLGEFLAGDRIESTPYILRMKQDTYCQQLCISNLGPSELSGSKPNKVIGAIRKDYHNNWIVDNLSSASKSEDEESLSLSYLHGFPIGYIHPKTHRAYIYNHVNIEIQYHEVDTELDHYRVVQFTVEPFSILHDFSAPAADNDDDDDDEVQEQKSKKHSPPKSQKFKKVTIHKPIQSCESNSKEHTNYDMVHQHDRNPQPASGKVLFTYDVIWNENKDLHWASRWDIYLNKNTAGVNKAHWLSLFNSLLVVFVLSAMIIAILIRNLRRDYARYNRLATDEEKAEDLEEFGWKLVHADVFRPPVFSPLLLAVSCGTGAQLLCMTILTIFFAALGFLSPAKRGALLTALLFLYVLMGSVSGYVTARLYKTFKGKSWQRATTLTAFGLPGIAFILFFFLDICAVIEHSTDAVPFKTMIILLVLWFGISTPLVFIGSYFGYKQDAIEFPVNTSNIPRQIPDQPWFMGTTFTLLVGGILPFGACFVELYFIMGSMWMEQYYYVFGFLFLVMIVLIITCAEVTILFCYFQLCGENYHWWWRSFTTAGSTAIYVWIYSFVYYFGPLGNNNSSKFFGTYVLYFGYMALISLGLFLMTGFIGVFSVLWFNRTIYASIKID